MPKWTLTATSRTGKKVNQITGGPSDSVAVHDEADLKRRLKAAEDDPRDLDVKVRRIS
ncbi:hypothetical protein [Streptomyces sp. NPDC002994]|uniref:hypothetical protein n=1 Tax=Streptomyces sp. NPDC002994 TaxID=3154441 RepID=UPI0033A3FDCA